MQFTGVLLLAAAQALWGKSLENDSHGVQVQELNVDVDYRDFNETVDLATEANRKPSRVVNESVDQDDKNGTENTNLTMGHDVFPINNSTYELRKDSSKDCSTTGEIYSWMNNENYLKIIQVLSLIAMSAGLLVVLTALKLRQTARRSWGYSPALMGARGYELTRVYQTNIH